MGERQRKEEEKRLAILEQEQRDHELAMRLAQDEGLEGQVNENDLVQLQSSAPAFGAVAVQKSTKKIDLSKYKYAELRDAINTSTDIAYIEECKEEFHRRLKVYHMWKAKNKANTNKRLESRAPQDVMQEANRRVPMAAPRAAAAASGQNNQR